MCAFLLNACTRMTISSLSLTIEVFFYLQLVTAAAEAVAVIFASHLLSPHPTSRSANKFESGKGLNAFNNGTISVSRRQTSNRHVTSMCCVVLCRVVSIDAPNTSLVYRISAAPIVLMDQLA